jgi:hypothetical protein
MKAKSLLPENRKLSYFLHKKIREFFKLNTPERVVFIPVEAIKDPNIYTESLQGYLKELNEFGYLLQLQF